MKAGNCFLVATLMVVGLLLTVGTASAWPDSVMPHYGKGQTDCSQGHMINGTHIGASYTFVMCKANSQANTWGASIKKIGGPTVCSLPMQAVPAGGKKLLLCNAIPTPGTYTATIWYTVPGDGTQYSQTDQYYLRP